MGKNGTSASWEVWIPEGFDPSDVLGRLGDGDIMEISDGEGGKIAEISGYNINARTPVLVRRSRKYRAGALTLMLPEDAAGFLADWARMNCIGAVQRRLVGADGAWRHVQHFTMVQIESFDQKTGTAQGVNAAGSVPLRSYEARYLERIEINDGGPMQVVRTDDTWITPLYFVVWDNGEVCAEGQDTLFIIWENDTTDDWILMRSLDGGHSWAEIDMPETSEPVALGSAYGRVYISHLTGETYYSEDAHEETSPTWVEIDLSDAVVDGGAAVPFYTRALDESTSLVMRTIVLATGAGTYRFIAESHDFGETWYCIYEPDTAVYRFRTAGDAWFYVESDQQTLQYDQGYWGDNGELVFAGTIHSVSAYLRDPTDPSSAECLFQVGCDVFRYSRFDEHPEIPIASVQTAPDSDVARMRAFAAGHGFWLSQLEDGIPVTYKFVGDGETMKRFSVPVMKWVNTDIISCDLQYDGSGNPIFELETSGATTYEIGQDVRIELADGTRHDAVVVNITSPGGNYGVVVRFKYGAHHCAEGGGFSAIIDYRNAVLAAFNVAVSPYDPNRYWIAYNVNG